MMQKGVNLGSYVIFSLYGDLNFNSLFINFAEVNLKN